MLEFCLNLGDAGHVLYGLYDLISSVISNLIGGLF